MNTSPAYPHKDVPKPFEKKISYFLMGSARIVKL